LSFVLNVYYTYANAVPIPTPPITHHMTFQANPGPVTNDPRLKVEVVFRGLKFPTSMAFLGSNDILVLEKNNGSIQRIVNGRVLPDPLLHINVLNGAERGLLGIAVSKHENVTGNLTADIFLYYTQAVRTKNTTISSPDTTTTTTSHTKTRPANSAINTIHNTTTTTIKTTTTTTVTKTTTITDTVHSRLSKYELVNNKLVNPKVILDLTTDPGFYKRPDHLGGKLLIGPDKNLYIAIGDIGGHMTQALNVKGGLPPDGTGGILRLTQEGQSLPDNPLGGDYPQDLYYAYGIRNSFGMDFDPLTHKLWDTENGPSFGDEINLVEPGFNSGWVQVAGIWKPSAPPNDYFPSNTKLNPANLTDFGGKGKYRAPELTWYNTIGPTALKFLNSSKFGKQYENDMLVGDFHNGNLYDFHLNTNRTGLLLEGPPTNKVMNTNAELNRTILGHGFGGITDMQLGPDGYLYILSLYAGGDDCKPSFPNIPCIPYGSPMKGAIFRVVPVNK
jgi:aldose sugar dehydrogenase